MSLRAPRGAIGAALVFACLASGGVAAAAAPKATARPAADARAESGEGWRRVPEWMKRNLDPRRLGRALRRDEPEAQQAAPAAPAPKRRPRAAAKRAAPQPAAPAPPPEPAPPPAAAPATPLAPAAGFEATRRADATLLRVGSGLLGCGALALVWGLRRPRRRVAPPAPPTIIVALPERALEEPAEATVATRPAATIDAVVETAIEHADVPLHAFPSGGRYEILEEIGRGGMGVVYEARDKRLDRVVAVKRLPDALGADPNAVALLLREARSAARLNHRNIVTVHDVDRDDGAWFIVMERLEGELLSEVLARQGRLSPPAVIRVARQVAAGLAYAHERGIVHRDVKPSNLFVTRDRLVKLMDFGVAKIVEEARRKKTLIGGTPSYMSPEQAAGEPVDGRTDLYALGATLFELLTGEVPFTRGDPTYHHRLTAPPDPRERAPAIPELLAALVLALLAKRPEARPASAAEVAERLRAIGAATLPAAGR
jgi:predicted Ser/Thr protein kinase